MLLFFFFFTSWKLLLLISKSHGLQTAIFFTIYIIALSNCCQNFGQRTKVRYRNTAVLAKGGRDKLSEISLRLRNLASDVKPIKGYIEFNFLSFCRIFALLRRGQRAGHKLQFQYVRACLKSTHITVMYVSPIHCSSSNLIENTMLKILPQADLVDTPFF